MDKNNIKNYFIKSGSTTSGRSKSFRAEPKDQLPDNGAQEVTTAGAAAEYDPDQPSTSGLNDTEGTRKEKKAVVTVSQKFKPEWTRSERYSCFERYDNDAAFAWCKVCLDKLSVARGGKSNLTSHLTTKRHQEASKTITVSAEAKIEPLMTADKVSQAELKLCGWAVENNISFAATEKLANVLKTIDTDSKILPIIKLSRTKAAAVVGGVIAGVQHDSLVQRMRSASFSLIIDESTDIGAVKTLAMVVRMMEDDGEALFQVRDYFYCAVELQAADHQTVYKAIVQQFEADGVDYKVRLKGFGSDGASVMMGREKSVMRLLKNDCPDLIVIKCSCHSLALCASYACEKMPAYVEQLMRNVHNYLSCSPKRTKEFEMIQSIVELKPLKVLHPSATRWLSLESVVKRNLERFAELQLFFSFQSKVDSNQTAQRILCHLNDPMTLPLLKFLDYVLPLINRLNRIFQSECSEFPNMYREIKSFFMVLLTNICRDSYVKTVSKGNAADFEKFLKKRCEIYIGLAAEDALKSGSLDEGTKETFFTICLNFYVELIKQVMKRFDLNDPVLKMSSLMDPRKLDNFTDLKQIRKQFPKFSNDCNDQELENEFRELRMLVLQEDISFDDKEDIEACWRKLLTTKRAGGELAFPLMRKFVVNFLIIPHSSASVERVFSQYNLNKTKPRNRLNTDSMNGILRSKCLMRTKGGPENLKFTSDYKSKFNKCMYSHHSKQ